MPPRKNTKYKKKTYKKRNYNYMPRGVSSVPSGMVRQRSTVLRYVEHIQALQSVSGGLGSYVFRANSIYDPNYTGTGHQPMCFDFYASIYNHYIVTASKITVKCIANQANTAPCLIGCYLTDGATVAYSTPIEFLEAKRGNSKTFSASEGRSVTVNSSFNAKKFYNVKDVKDNQANLGAAVTTSPVEECYYNIYFFTLDSTTEDCNVQITIDYWVTFNEPKDISQS